MGLRIPKTFVLFVIAFLLFSPLRDLWPQDLSYSYLMELGVEALDRADYDEALHYFTLAQALKPSEKEPLFYINLIKRIREGSVFTILSPGEQLPVAVPAPAPLERRVSLRQRQITLEDRQKRETILRALGALPEDQVVLRQDLEERRIAVEKALDDFTRAEPRAEEAARAPLKELVMIQEVDREEKVIYLDDQLWSSQPKTTLEIEMGRDLIVKGRRVSRFLALAPEFVDVEKRTGDELRVKAIQRGSGTILVWDQSGRWTLTINVLPPVPVVPIKEEDRIIEYAQPFRLLYGSNWEAFYRGRRLLDDMHRQSLIFNQGLSIYGDTPYGEFDGFLRWEQSGDSSEITAYSLGLTDGDLGFVSNFDARAFDIYKTFSELSYPGTYLMGGLWEQRIFDGAIEYTALWGQERGGVLGFLAPGVIEERDSYIEGGKVTFFPRAKHNLSLNYARGYGSGREFELKDEVYSVETRHSLPNLSIFTETAFDEDVFAGVMESEFGTDTMKIWLNLRDIDTDFRNIIGRPPNQGEIGGILGFDWQISEALSLYSNLDVYKDRLLPNEAEPDKLNYDYNGRLLWRIDPTSSLHTSTSYVYNPGLLSPRRSLN
ncbi:pilus assembly protein N-terminal domain-containing protein, partial [Candidatus Omnitrophota bacterium]